MPTPPGSRDDEATSNVDARRSDISNRAPGPARDGRADRPGGDDEKVPGTTIWIALGALVAACALAIGWQWTPLREWIDLAEMLGRLKSLGHTPLAVLIVLAAYPLSSLVMLPSMVLILVTIALFGPLVGFAYATLGCLLSALASYLLGRILGRQHLGRLQRRIDQVARLLSGHEVLAIAMINWSMIVNLGLVGLAAGVLRIRLPRYLLGTLIGITPGIVALTLIETQLEIVIRNPSPGNAAALAAVVAFLLLIAFWGVRRSTWARRP